MLKNIPLSKVPSPNCSDVTSVKDANTPNLVPFINDLENEVERKNQNREISHGQISRVESYSLQRSGNYTNSHSYAYSQRLEESQNQYNDFQHIQNYNDPLLNGINSQYYESQSDDEDNNLKRKLTLTQKQKPKRQKR